MISSSAASLEGGSDTGVRVPINKVSPIPGYKPATIPGRQLASKSLLTQLVPEGYTYEAFSHSSFDLVDASRDTKNPLVAAAHLAFARHLPLILSPEAVWVTIMQGVSRHTAQDPERFRHLAVSHEGKKELRVRDDGLFKGQDTRQWERVTPQFSKLIKENTVEGPLRDALDTRFSKTTATESAAFTMVFMDAVKHYFHLTCMTLCGIPYVELTGCQEDWQLLISKLEMLEGLGLQEWRDMLIKILQHFVAAYDGQVDHDFWNSLYLENGPQGSGENWTEVTGWLAKLFLYTNFGINSAATVPLPPPSELWTEDRWTGSQQLKDIPGVKRLEPADFPCGRTSTPFTWEYFGQEYTMCFSAGLVGVSVSGPENAVRPEVGWLVLEKLPEEQGPGSRP